MIGGKAHSGVPLSTMVVLMASVFTVSMGFGVLLPLLPYLIERLLGAGDNTAQVSRATGLLTGLYTLSLFLFAPLWGRMSDRYGRRDILLAGLIGFSATMITFGFIENLTAVYIERFLSGMSAAAVTPVALATIGDLAETDEARARRLTFVSLAGIGGFLLSPMLGVFIARSAASMLPIVSAAGSLAQFADGPARKWQAPAGWQLTSQRLDRDDDPGGKSGPDARFAVVRRGRPGAHRENAGATC